MFTIFMVSDRDREFQDGYDWKTNIDGRRVSNSTQTLLHRLCVGMAAEHSCPNRTCACEPSDWCFAPADLVGMAALGDFSFRWSLIVESRYPG